MPVVGISAANRNNQVLRHEEPETNDECYDPKEQ
jgi:hypothetical protein